MIAPISLCFNIGVYVSRQRLLCQGSKNSGFRKFGTRCSPAPHGSTHAYRLLHSIPQGGAVPVLAPARIPSTGKSWSSTHNSFALARELLACIMEALEGTLRVLTLNPHPRILETKPSLHLGAGAAGRHHGGAGRYAARADGSGLCAAGGRLHRQLAAHQPAGAASRRVHDDRNQGLVPTLTSTVGCTPSSRCGKS